MRVVLGFATVAAGSAAAFMWLTPLTTESELAVVSGIERGGVARVARKDAVKADTEQTAGRFFGFALPTGLYERAVTGGEATARPTDAPPNPGRSWEAEVITYPGGVQDVQMATVVAPAGRVLTSAPAPGPALLPPRDRPRHELVRDLQRELKRVGCYHGEVDGDWGPGSRRSMRAFLDQVNSRLQSEEPDDIQFTLVRGYNGAACRGTQAPAPGQLMAARPHTPPPPQPQIAASPPVLVPTPPPSQIVTSSVAPPPLPLPAPAPPASFDGRMSVGGPVPPPGQAAPPPALTRPPVRVARPPPRQSQQSRSARQTAPPPRRGGGGERGWTASFFNQ